MADNVIAPSSGTRLANYSFSPSCEHRLGRGGPRNRSDRVSSALSQAQVSGLIDASLFALATGRVFQRHWIIHYGKAGIIGQDGTRFISHVLSLAGKQARRDGGVLTAIWVRECASAKGEHVHVLLHLPAATRLHGRTRGWITAAGGTWGKGVSKIRIVGGQLNRGDSRSGPGHRLNAFNVTRYLLKAASAETAFRYNLQRAGEGGRIIGKRCGWTQNIGQKARLKRRFGCEKNVEVS